MANICSSRLLQSMFVLIALVASSAVFAEDESFRVEVDGGKDKTIEHLRAFHAGLRKIVGQDDLSDAYIECANCARLDEPVPTVKKLTYYFLRGRPDSQFAIISAWQAVQREMFSPTFTLLFDGEPPKGPLCEGYQAPCAPRAFCVSMGGCSKQQSPLPCKKCDPLP